MSDVPEWVKVWVWHRKVHPDDGRPFPQQLDGDGRVLADPLDYQAVLAEWRRGRDDGSAFLEFLKEAA